MAQPISRLDPIPMADIASRSLEEEGAVQRRQRVSALSRILRAIGAGALIASASTFLLQRWESGGDLQRYFTLLAHPLLLCVAGFVCGLRANDGKAARTFLALASALVPVQFCILGGLLYSQFSWDGALVAVPTYASWMAPGPFAALATAGITLALLTPVIGVAFLTLSRARALPLTLAYLAANLTLLVPTRDPSIAAALAALTLGGLVALDSRVGRRDASLRTLEGTFVRAMLFAPPLLLLLRSALHYELSALFAAVLSGLASFALVAIAGVRRLPEGLREVLPDASLLPTLATSVFAAGALFDAGIPASIAFPAGVLCFGGMTLSLSLVAGSAAWGARHRRVAVVGTVCGMAVDLVIHPCVVASLGCLVTAIAALSHGYLMERRAIFVTGLAAALFGLVFHVRYALGLYAYTRWGSLALLGIAVILAASWLERHWDELVARASVFRERFAAWE
jgi:hypothetical protein